MTTSRHEQRAEPGRRAVWAAGLVVATGAGVATAHGLYQVAAAAQVPAPIAWLYPLITDGLALVAYAATSRLDDGGRRYAATIVVLAASLSGLAQAVYLAGGIARTTTAPVGLRFGVGAWPAIAAAITAHLLHLIATGSTAADPQAVSQPLDEQDGVFNAASVQPYNQPSNLNGVEPDRSMPRPESTAVQPARSTEPEPSNPPVADGQRSGSPGGASPASERARAAARRHHARHGQLPTVTELMELAQVARGTAGTVLKDLRENRPALHVVNTDTDQETDQ
jgi:hypothetical protein